MSYNINKTIEFVNSIEYKRELKREIEKLRQDEHLEIFKIIKTPVLDGLIFTFLIFNFEFFANAVKTIKKALELMSAGIL